MFGDITTTPWTVAAGVGPVVRKSLLLTRYESTNTHVVPRFGKCLCQSCERHLPRSIDRNVTEAPVGAEKSPLVGTWRTQFPVPRTSTDYEAVNSLSSFSTSAREAPFFGGVIKVGSALDFKMPSLSPASRPWVAKCRTRWRARVPSFDSASGTPVRALGAAFKLAFVPEPLAQGRC